jgi:hypothetical protein
VLFSTFNLDEETTTPCCSVSSSIISCRFVGFFKLLYIYGAFMMKGFSIIGRVSKDLRYNDGSKFYSGAINGYILFAPTDYP